MKKNNGYNYKGDMDKHIIPSIGYSNDELEFHAHIRVGNDFLRELYEEKKNYNDNDTIVISMVPYKNTIHFLIGYKIFNHFSPDVFSINCSVVFECNILNFMLSCVVAYDDDDLEDELVNNIKIDFYILHENEEKIIIETNNGYRMCKSDFYIKKMK